MSKELMSWLKKPSPFQNLYFVVGNDPFFLSEIKNTFKKSALSQNKDFNQDEVSAGETPIGDILTLFETLPLLSEKRLLFCSQAQKFSEKDWNQLIPVLTKKPADTLLVCFFEKKDARRTPFRQLKQKAQELKAMPLKSWELAPWLDFIISREGLSFSPPAKLLFQDLLGCQLMEIKMELKKLKQYLGKKNQVEEKDVLACTSRLKIDSLFDWTEALGHKDIVKSLSLLARLLEQNQNEIGILSLLSRHIRILSKIKQGQKEKLSSAQLASKAGLSPYFLNNYLKQAQLWTESQIESTLQSLFVTDQALKSSALPSHVWLENLILKICS